MIEANIEQRNELDTELYLIMERIDGGAVSGQVQFTRSQPHFALRLTKSLCRTLSISHQIGVVHRDIKPDNLLIRAGSECDLVVVDFGLSFNTTSPRNLTSVEEVVGNRFLILPETAPGSGDTREPQADVTRAVGLLFYLLSGRPPMMLRDARDNPPHFRGNSEKLIRDAWPERADAVLQVFDRGFTHEPRYRFRSADELLAALESLEDPGLTFPSLRRSLEPTRELVHAAASGISKLHKLVSGDPLNGVRPETIDWLEAHLVAVLRYSLQRDASGKRSKQSHQWPKAVAKAMDTVKNTAPPPHHVLTTLECQYVGDIFGVQVFPKLDCDERVSELCVSKTGSHVSVFRRHAGASNLYSLGVLVERALLLSAQPKVYRFRESGLACWRCGIELEEGWAY